MLEFLTFLQEHLCKPIQDAYPCRGGLIFCNSSLHSLSYSVSLSPLCFRKRKCSKDALLKRRDLYPPKLNHELPNDDYGGAAIPFIFFHAVKSSP